MPRFMGWSLFALLLTIASAPYLLNSSHKRVYIHISELVGRGSRLGTQEADAFSWSTVRHTTNPTR
jgi:hypothetical protein